MSSDELTTDELDVSERFDRHPVPPPLLVHQGCARAHEPAGHAGVVVEVIAALEDAHDTAAARLHHLHKALREPRVVVAREVVVEVVAVAVKARREDQQLGFESLQCRQ